MLEYSPKFGNNIHCHPVKSISTKIKDGGSHQWNLNVYGLLAAPLKVTLAADFDFELIKFALVLLLNSSLISIAAKTVNIIFVYLKSESYKKVININTNRNKSFRKS